MGRCSTTARRAARDGSGASARASATRCWPPESSCGGRPPAAQVDDGEQGRHAGGPLLARQAEPDILRHGQVRRARSPGRPSRPGAVRDAPVVLATGVVELDGAGVRNLEAGDQAQEGRLPSPRGRAATNSPRSTHSCASSTARTAPKRFDTPWQQIIPHAICKAHLTAHVSQSNATCRLGTGPGTVPRQVPSRRFGSDWHAIVAIDRAVLAVGLARRDGSRRGRR